jgi:hypothetical protein
MTFSPHLRKIMRRLRRHRFATRLPSTFLFCHSERRRGINAERFVFAGGLGYG